MIGGVGIPEIVVIIVVLSIYLLPAAALLAFLLIAKRALNRLAAVEARLTVLEAASLAARKDIG